MIIISTYERGLYTTTVETKKKVVSYTASNRMDSIKSALIVLAV